jgi:hypothetical protein
MGTSRHEGGSDVLTSSDDLYVALGVRLRERPGARWMVEIHPETSAGLDLGDFNLRFGFQDVRLQESRYVARGEFRLSQRGFGLTGAGRKALAVPTAADARTARLDPSGAPTVGRGYPDWRKRLTRNLSRRSDGPWDPLTFFEEVATP